MITYFYLFFFPIIKRNLRHWLCCNMQFSGATKVVRYRGTNPFNSIIKLIKINQNQIIHSISLFNYITVTNEIIKYFLNLLFKNKYGSLKN